ncbi:hypothetical protein [Spirulina major]|uniref:hypothetical protein n=1 Tax=Spirulina major TaxID=270636 RepID=UPI0009335E79|nr:hypothetical protein [Spirulina major]
MNNSERPPLGGTGTWYLGLAIDAQGLTAALWQPGQTAHPFRWQEQGETQTHLPLCAQFFTKTTAEDGAQLILRVGREVTATTPPTQHLYLEQFHTYLQRAMPFYSRKQRQWLPKVYVTGGKQMPLHWLQRALQQVLRQLLPQTVRSPLAAAGLPPNQFLQAMHNLAGVVITQPLAWGAAARFNWREAVVGAGLVQHPEQIFFTSAPTAVALRSELPPATPTLIITSQGTSTDVAIALPQGPLIQDTCPYGYQDIYADIFYQLLYPQWLPAHDFLTTMTWDMPWPGYPDRQRRDRAAAALQRHAMGAMVMTVATRVAQLLCHQPTFTTHLGDQPWTVSRADLQAKILTPWFDTLNTTLNDVLSTAGVTTTQITRLLWHGPLCHYGMPELQAQLAWKFPNAQLQAVTEELASGAAQLARHPVWCDRFRHQYDDLFLLAEILRLNPHQPMTLKALSQALQRRGVNLTADRSSSAHPEQRLQALLENQFPPGFMPTPTDPWIVETSHASLEYQAIAAAPLFDLAPDGNGYCLNPIQAKRLRQYFTLLLTQTTQKLTDPLSFPLRSLLPLG